MGAGASSAINTGVKAADDEGLAGVVKALDPDVQEKLMAELQKANTTGTKGNRATGKELYDAMIKAGNAGAGEAAILELMDGPPVDVHAADFQTDKALEYKDPEKGWSLLFVASRYGFDKAVGKLLAADIPPNYTGNLIDDGPDGWSPLLIAARYGHLGVVRQLLESGADKTYAVHHGLANAEANATEMARRSEQTAVIEMLTAVDGRNLFNAIMMKDEKTAKELIDGGADIHWTEAVYGADSLLAACNRGLSNTVRLLIAAGGNINSQQSYGFTCLITAAYGGHIDCVKQLLAAGADKTIKTKDGATALDCAEKAGQADVADLLRD